ncbi:hypothetical protein B0H13DRAFT_1935118 [Mycena leptocephala]|nr:hypothetical protein B0H13DRAFT_1935118 [Mycena leptocephala]
MPFKLVQPSHWPGNNPSHGPHFRHPSTLGDSGWSFTLSPSLFSSWWYRPIPNPEALIDRIMGQIDRCHDTDLKYFELYHSHNIQQSLKLCQAALSLSISTQNTKRQCDVLNKFAWLKWKLADYSASQKHAHESRRLAWIMGDSYKEAQALRTEAMCWYTLGNYTRSISLNNSARHLLALCSMSGGAVDHAIMSSLAEIGTPRNDIQRYIDGAKSIFNRIGHPDQVVWCDVLQAELHLREGDRLGGKTLLQKSIRISWGRDSENVANCFEKLADTSYGGAMDVRSNWPIVFFSHSLKFKQRLGIHKGLQFLSDVFLGQGDEDTATSLLTIALEGFTQMDVHRSRAECLFRLGDIAKGRSDSLMASEHWKIAKPLFAKASQAIQLAQIEGRLASAADDLYEVLSENENPRKLHQQEQPNLIRV